MSPRLRHFRLMPSRQLTDSEATRVVAALKVLGLPPRSDPDAPGWAEFEDVVSPHCVAIIEAIAEYRRAVSG